MTYIVIILLSILSFTSDVNVKSQIHGAWQSENGIAIFSGNYFAYTAFTETEFKYSYGGSWEIDGENMIISYEFNTLQKNIVGSSIDAALKVNEENMVFNGQDFARIDNGIPGKLEGAWLFSNRMRNGELGSPRSDDNPRKTMKILSGTRFQWIAYNIETKEFMGTGGGTYTTANGKYTENIDFFSRDNSRVGASLEFDFEIKGNDWHHKGFSSKGDPMHEIWSLRK